MDRKKGSRLFWVGLILGTGMWGLLNCSRSSDQTLTLAGSTAFQPFAEKLAEHYMAQHPGVKINVQGGGSAVGIQAALAKTAQIGMADLLELPQETKSLSSTIVSKDGIAIIVHPTNPLSNVTSNQARAIFSGKITQWKELGGPQLPIRVVSREDGSGTRTSFDSLVLMKEKLTPLALFQNSNGTVREAVASDPSSIGYISMSLVDSRIKALAYEGVLPNNQNVSKGLYPLSRPVYFLTRGLPSQNVKSFMEYVLGPQAQEMLRKEGLVPLR